MVTGVWRVYAAYQFYGPGRVLLVNPELIGLEIRRVQVGFRRIEHHAVDTRVWLVGVVLDVVGEGAR